MQINVQQENRNPIPPKRLFPKFFWSFVIILFIVLGFLFAKAYSVSSKIFVGRSTFFTRLTSIVMHPFGTFLSGERSGQINILLLGYGGAGHDGPYLTDSIILAEIKPNDKKVVLYSIPRDWNYPTSIGQKINDAYALGYVNGKKDPALGGAKAEEAVGKLTGLDVPYFAALDFSGFEKAINQVGGLDITIDNTFTDSQYPNDATAGFLPPVTFVKGTEHMDGARALIFARSRHGTGDEASDFARSHRQEKILQAFRAKASQLNFFSDTSTINSLINILSDHFSTNLEPQELIHLRELLSTYSVETKSFDENTGLVCQKIIDDGEFVLSPCVGVTDTAIRDFFNGGNISTNVTANLSTEKASIILENSGTDNGFYAEVKNTLNAAGITVYEVGYKGIPLAASVLYEVDKKPLTEAFLQNKYNLTAMPKPAQMTAKSDLVLIVGGRNE